MKTCLRCHRSVPVRDAGPTDACAQCVADLCDACTAEGFCGHTDASHPAFLPCPFCNEVEHLTVMERYAERLVFGADDQILRDADGLEVLEEVDFVYCEICDATAPVDVWNTRALPRPQQRATMVAYMDSKS